MTDPRACSATNDCHVASDVYEINHMNCGNEIK